MEQREKYVPEVHQRVTSINRGLYNLDIALQATFDRTSTSSYGQSLTQEEQISRYETAAESARVYDIDEQRRLRDARNKLAGIENDSTTA